MQKCATPLPALFAPNLHASTVGGGTHPPTAELRLNQKNLQMSRVSKKMNSFLEESCDLKEDRSCSSPGKAQNTTGGCRS